MIYGIGIDLVENERMEKIIAKWGEKFLSRVFSDGEIAYCSRHAQASLHYGARFAVKEAFLKPSARGWAGVFGCGKSRWSTRKAESRMFMCPEEPGATSMTPGSTGFT